MAKVKTAWFCQNCGAKSNQWTGQCKSCKEWNTLVEEVLTKPNKSDSFIPETEEKENNSPKHFKDIDTSTDKRIILPDNELNRVLGGGVVPGSLVLLGGEPGIGKSTLLLQIARNIKNINVLYVSGEESSQQIKMRGERLGGDNDNFYVLTETSTQNIFHHIKSIQVDLLVIDSIQTLHTSIIDSTAGSISQIRECTAELIRFAKKTNIPVFLVGHINKDGHIAGPKILEHMVDSVVQFEGDQHHAYRILRVIKNRFGSTAEMGIYEMRSNGLKEVPNPSEILLSNRDKELSGVTTTCTLEGIRPILIETQALVSSAVYGTPQRTATGFDTKRLNMLLAVLEKRCGFKLGAKDVFLNIAGGIRVDDPAIDLGVMCAVLSSSEDMPVSANVCFAGEVGLSGEIRAVNRIEQRISEAEKLGFEKIFLSKYNMKGIDKSSLNIELAPVAKIEEVFQQLFG